MKIIWRGRSTNIIWLITEASKLGERVTKKMPEHQSHHVDRLLRDGTKSVCSSSAWCLVSARRLLAFWLENKTMVAACFHKRQALALCGGNGGPLSQMTITPGPTGFWGPATFSSPICQRSLLSPVVSRVPQMHGAIFSPCAASSKEPLL